jgi:hypothetical protein
MRRSSIAFAVALVSLLAACGGDDGDSGAKKSPQKSSSDTPKDGVACGSKQCTVPKGVEGEACCNDSFSSVCGLKATSGGQCRALPKIDDRCPAPDLNVRLPMQAAGQTQAYGCCTSDNECGIDFGGGCQPRTVACMVVGPDQVDKIKRQTCDGKPLELPADCGMNPINIPGAGRGAAGSMGSM